MRAITSFPKVACQFCYDRDGGCLACLNARAAAAKEITLNIRCHSSEIEAIAAILQPLITMGQTKISRLSTWEDSNPANAPAPLPQPTPAPPPPPPPPPPAPPPPTPPPPPHPPQPIPAKPPAPKSGLASALAKITPRKITPGHEQDPK